MKRQDVEKRLTWATEDVYPTDEDWEKHYDDIFAKLDFSDYHGKLGDKGTLLKYMKTTDDIEEELMRLAMYAEMLHDQDTSDSKYTSYFSKVGMLFSKYSEAIAFFRPEMTSYDEAYLNELVKDKDFSDYDYALSCLIKQKPHVLGADEERIIALSSETLQTFQEIFGMIDNADFKPADIEYKGEQTKLTHGLYSIILREDDREKRAEAYDKYYSVYNSLINTITETYYGNVKKDVFLSRAYKYNSCLEMALSDEDIKPVVYTNLLESVKYGFDAMHNYIKDRRDLLGAEKLYFYDINAYVVKDVDFSLDYDKSYDLVIEGLGVLGKEYQKLLKQAHDERWLDVEETDNKRSGAYSTGGKGMHPYVLLNFKGTLNDVFTIAHEMGHSIHTYFSCKNQPYAKSDYKIFVAEVASTVNEVLLLKYLLKKYDDKNLKIYLLNHYLETIRTTLFRQTLFAEFEYKAHKLVEEGTPLTKENLSQIYGDLNKEYYGDAIEHDYNISIEWCRVPHFYRSFYVYKYSTGITAAINIANRILTEGESALKDYFKFLSGGNSQDPVSLIRLAGVDLETKAPFEFAMKEFETTLKEFEKMCGLSK